MDTAPTIDKLRRLADWLETHELPDDMTIIVSQNANLSLFTHDADTLRQVRRLVGRVDKDTQPNGGLLLTGRVDGDIDVRIWPPDDVCRQVQVGTELRPVVRTEETGEYETVPVFEWECGDVLRDEPAAVA